MPNRILKEWVRKKEEIDALTPEEEVFYYRLITCCDDFGLMDARPIILRAECFPLKIEILTNADIERWLGKLVDVELVQLYTHKGQPYLKMVGWEDDQQIRAKRPKYPEPNGHILAPDSIGNQTISDEVICPRNPIQSNPIQIESNHVGHSEEQPESEPEPEPAASPKAKRQFEPDSKEYKLAAHLRESILRNNPGAKVPELEAKGFQSWCKDIDLMIRRDGRDGRDIWRVINWCQQDRFWHANILSTTKLRDKYDTLFMQMNRSNRPRSQPDLIQATATARAPCPQCHQPLEEYVYARVHVDGEPKRIKWCYHCQGEEPDDDI